MQLFTKNIIFNKSSSIQGIMVEYLPTYSPDLNPIEHKWAQAKSKKQKAKKERVVAIQRFCSQSIWCNQN
ncbi:transposase [Symbiopectobacterium sp. RP]|uniref:transposase n=1 Tax=Symbiopectobacterium sp. RP TaxID=3248553 RepID=UPI003D27AFF4